MTNRTRLAPLTLIAIAGLATLVTPTIAQDSPRPSRRASEDRPMLAGPRVREQRMPGAESGFSAGAEGGSRMGAQFVPPQVFREALAGLMVPDAPLEIRLSAEQRERITAHVRAFEQRGQQSRPTGDARQGAPQDRPAARPSDRADRPGPQGQPQRDRPRADQPRPDQGQTDRPRTDRFRRDQARPDAAPADRRPAAPQRDARPEAPRGDAPQAPRGERPADRGNMRQAVVDLQNKIWAELSAAQQAHVAKSLDAWRAKAADEQMGQMRERYRREIGARFEQMDEQRVQPADRRGERAAGEAGGGATELRQWFAQLPEDAQRRVHERLREMPQERREALMSRAAEASPEQRAQFVRRLLQSDRGQSAPSRPQ